MPKSPRFLPFCIYALFTVCPLLFFTDLTRNPYYTQIALLNILICAAWLLWILQAWKTGEWVWVRSPLDVWLWALMGVCLLSWVSSFVQHRHFTKSIYSEGSRAQIFLIVNCYLAFAAAIRFQDRDRLRRLLWISYAVAVAASIYGIAQYFGTEWVWPHNLNPYGSRPVSTFGNPNFMSSYLTMILPIAIADYALQVTGLPRVPLAGVILISLSALIATLTRSSWGGAVAGVAVVGIGIAATREVWPSIRKPVLALAAAMLLLIVAWPKSSTAAYSETVIGRLTEVKKVATGGYGAVSQRFLIWLCAWQMVQDHPVLGKGWGCFELFYPFYQGAQLDKKVFVPFRTHANNAHDEILEYWSQVGTVGLGLVLFIWVFFFRMGGSIAGRLPVPWKAMAWGLMGGVAGMLADNLLNVSVHFAVPGFMFWWWVGSVFTLEPAALQVSTTPLSQRGRALLGAAALCLIGFSVRSAMLWAEEINFFNGFKLSKGGVDLTAARLKLEKAYRFHALDVNNAYELANVYARLGLKEQALAMYQRALDANAGYDEIYFNRATMYLQSGNETEAIRNYRTALGINPLSREGYNALAGIYLKDLSKYGDAATALYRRAVEIYPDDKDYWNNLGYVEVQRQRWEEAYQAYRKALDADPDFDLPHRNLAVVADKLPAHANDPYLRINERFGDVERLMKDKKWMDALSRANAMVDMLPRSARAHFYVGTILFAMNHLPEAVGEFEKATQLHPEQAGTWLNLAVTYDRLNRPVDAEAAWRHVLAVDPNNAQAKARLKIP